MIAPRIFWAICLSGALIFFLFSPSWIALALLTAIIFVPLILLVVNYLTASKLDMKVKLPAIGKKNSKLNCCVQLINDGVLPHAPIMSELRCENLLTGEVLTPKFMFPVGAKSEEEVFFKLDSTYCGTVAISLDQPRVYDPFGLWARKLTLNTRGTICVLPNTFSPHIAIQQSLSQNIEADEYSQQKAGSDPSETFAVRAYRPGDSLNRIHWKLTSKFDEMMVREASLPVLHSFMVLLETTSEPGQPAQTPQVLDAKMEIVVSICQVLVEEEIIFDLAWFDSNEQKLVLQQVANAADFSGLLSKLMAVESRNQTQNVTYFAEQLSTNTPEHIVYVSHYLHPDIIHFAGGGKTTAIICRDNEEYAMVSEGNATTYYCTPKNFERELAYLEI